MSCDAMGTHRFKDPLLLLGGQGGVEGEDLDRAHLRQHPESFQQKETTRGYGVLLENYSSAPPKTIETRALLQDTYRKLPVQDFDMDHKLGA
jgi:hypothetical protein